MAVLHPSSRQSGAALPMVLWRQLKSYAVYLQRGLRSSELTQIIACALTGGLVGSVITLLHHAIELLHRLDFALPRYALLSTGQYADHLRILLVPAAGGLLLGLTAAAWRRLRTTEIVDPIEANALHGGRMSLRDSIRLAVSTLISNGAGASLGMEAGYSQLGAGIFSKLGQYFHLRRADQRVFVTAGAAAAIAAAFNAPLAGIFYGYELVLGSYLPRALAPVAVASVCGALAVRGLGGMRPLFAVTPAVVLNDWSYILFGLIGLLSSAVAIVAMMGVTWCERGMRALPIPDWCRPAIGGALLSAVAIWFPQVLGSGHGAIQYHLDVAWTFWPLMGLLIAKLVASAISVGSGFRGGLFSSSLFLGCLFGAICGQGLVLIDPSLANQQTAFLLVGMGSVAAAIVGAPFTMVFLVLEATGDFPITAGVLAGVVAASTIVRLTFGYSFATWRFHVRGLGIRGAHDVGWIADLSVGRLMRADPKLVPAAMPLTALRAKYPPGAAKRVFATGPDGSFAGSLDMEIVHDPQLDEAIEAGIVADLAEDRHTYLLEGDSVRVALARFEEARCESLPVLSDPVQRIVTGYLTEAYALRRYTQELERRRSAELGEQDLFSLGQKPGR